MSIVIIGLLTLAATSLGLRTTSFLAIRVHPIVRIVLALVVGVVLSAAVLQFFDSYQVFEFGLGLLVSLSPVGLFDLAKWWFTWRNQPQRG